MEIAIALFIAWVAITLLGHVSWLLVSGVFRLLLGIAEPPAHRQPQPARGESDFDVTRRMIQRMLRENRIREEVAIEMLQKLRQTEHFTAPSPESLAVSRPQEPSAVEATLPEARSTSLQPDEISGVSMEPTKTSPELDHLTEELGASPQAGIATGGELVGEPVDVSMDEEEPVTAWLVEAGSSEFAESSLPEIRPVPEIRPASLPSDRPAWQASSESAFAPGASIAPATERSVLSPSEVIQSFLSAHNIRWGELVAGMLIVICSIGLVRTLWSPLVETHRVVPSLIFLCANAAIYAAGLYTLSRWRLRHTSRAVLIIATLLVPLSILAGLAAAGTGKDAVQLTDLITLATLVLAGGVYGWLVYRGAKALSRRSYAIAIAASVAGPVAILPLIPAAVRNLGPHAGWLTLIGSLSVFLAAAWIAHRRGAQDASIGPAGARVRLLVLAFGAYSLAVAASYFVFYLPDHEWSSLLPVAIASVPAMISLAGLSQDLSERARRQTLSMVGAVTLVLLTGMALLVIPASLRSASWLWTWALSAGLSAALVGYLFGQPRWLAMTTVPVGLAAVLTSKVWIAGQPWGVGPLWMRLVSGEAMVASLMMTVATGGWFWANSDSGRRRWLEGATLGWGGLTLVLAAVLSFAPDRLLGVVPAWLITLVLLIAVVACFLYSLRDARSSYAAAAAVLCVWLSMLKPAEWFARESLPQWLWLASAVAASLLTMSELIARLAATKSPRTQASAERAAGLWIRGSDIALALAAVLAVIGVEIDWLASTITLAIAACLALWGSSMSGSIERLRGSQLATIALAGVVGYSQFPSWLWEREAWTSGRAIWCWSISAGSVVMLWWVIRELADFVTCGCRSLSSESDAQGDATMRERLADRIRPVFGDAAAWSVMPDGWMACASAALVTVAVAYFFLTLSVQVDPEVGRFYEVGGQLASAGTAMLGLVCWATFRQDRREVLFRELAVTAMLATTVWAACQLTHGMSWQSSHRLIAAVTLIVATVCGLEFWLTRGAKTAFASTFRSASLGVVTIVVAAASSCLLRWDWYLPIARGELAAVPSTVAVAIWWSLGALWLLWKSAEVSQPASGIASVLLFSTSAALVVPAFEPVPIVVWMQVAALAATVWMLLARWIRQRGEAAELQGTLAGTLAVVILLGLVTSVTMTVGIVLDRQFVEGVEGPAGFLLSLFASVALCSQRLRSYLRVEIDWDRRWAITWPVGISLLAGQIAWIFLTSNWISPAQGIEAVVAVWVATSIGALVTYSRSRSDIDFLHIGGVAAISTGLALWSGPGAAWIAWLALAGLVSAGVLVTFVGVCSDTGPARATFARVLGWFVGGAGIVVLLNEFSNWGQFDQVWTMIVLWLTGWIMVWRWIGRSNPLAADERRWVRLTIPDIEFAVALVFACLYETIYFAVEGAGAGGAGLITNPLFWLRLAGYLLASGSALWQADRRLVWVVSVATLLLATALLSVKVTIGWEGTLSQRVAWGTLSCGFMMAWIAHWLPGLARMLGRFTHVSPNQYFGQLVQATWINAALVALFGAAIAIGMMVVGAPAAEIHLTIATVALAGWAVAEMADESDHPKLRPAAVGFGLAAIGLWASVDSGETSHPVLAAAMRWLVASVLLIPTMLFALPKLLGRNAADRWRDAIGGGVKVVGVTALASLISMLLLEVALRDANGIAGIPLVIVIGVMFTLAALSVLSGVVSILSAPNSRWRDRLELSARQRMVLIAGAQIIGVLTWLHVFLCRPNWAFVGFRDYWPYLVLILAFVSVGLTEWARRRDDVVMAKTLQQTAMYLPLVPVIGFWLGGGVGQLEWLFAGGQVRYDVVLFLGAIYYAGVGFLWKGVMPRVSAIVLANAAWWVVLTQWPGWGFLSHPQLWLIPPAVCVLVVGHWYRDRLEAPVASAIRYASMLTIYISSTADMLIQEIGTTLWGPIVLILLALAGMLAGVVLRVRPFLYLGASFIFLGVVSMVWHAHRALDSVWPWWVFGITTGLCLLAGLMAIEKYKPRLRQYANELARWEG